MSKSVSFNKLMYSVGLIGVLGVFFYLEWDSLKENFSLIINPMVHLGNILAMFVHPVFWVSFVLLAVGHVRDMMTPKEEE